MYPRRSEHKMKLITNVTIFAALLKNIPMGCPDSVIPEPLLRHTQVNCLLSNKTTNHKKIIRVFSAYWPFTRTDTLISTLTFPDILQNLYQNLVRILKRFCVVSVEGLPVVEEIVQRNIFIYDFDIQEAEYVGKLARRSIGKFDKTVKLLRFNNIIIHTNYIDSVFKCFRCPSCDTFFHKSDHFNQHLLRCKDRLRHIYPKNVYGLCETLFEKLEGFSLPVSEK